MEPEVKYPAQYQETITGMSTGGGVWGAAAAKIEGINERESSRREAEDYDITINLPGLCTRDTWRRAEETGYRPAPERA